MSSPSMDSSDEFTFEYHPNRRQSEAGVSGPLHDHPREERWVVAWKNEKLGAGIPGMVANAVWIAERSSREQLDLFLPFIRLIMTQYPAPRRIPDRRTSTG